MSQSESERRYSRRCFAEFGSEFEFGFEFGSEYSFVACSRLHLHPELDLQRMLRKQVRQPVQMT